MNTSQRPQLKVRFGMVKIRVGSKHMIKGKDGIARHFTVLDYSRNPDRKSVAICLHCKQTWPTMKELLASHQPNAVLRKLEETHVYGYWCDEQTVPLDKNDKNAKADPGKVVGFLSEEEEEPV